MAIRVHLASSSVSVELSPTAGGHQRKREEKKKPHTSQHTISPSEIVCCEHTTIFKMYSSIRMHLQIITFMDKLLKGMRPPEDHLCEVNFKPVSPFFHFASVNVIIDLNG